MALASPHVKSTSIESREFPELAGEYEVYAVPKIVVGDRFEFTGGLPEEEFVNTILTGVSGASAAEASGEQSAI